MKLRFDGRDRTDKFRYSEMRRCRPECICACTGILFFVPLVAVPESRYGRYWANQGLIVLLVEFVCLICGFVTGWIFGLLAMIPAVGVVFAVLKKITSIALWLTAAFYIIYAAAHAARCRAKDVPFFGYMRFIR